MKRKRKSRPIRQSLRKRVRTGTTHKVYAPVAMPVCDKMLPCFGQFTI